MNRSSIQTIADKMEKIETGDQEVDHRKADDLLLYALSALAGTPTELAAVARIIRAYHLLPKWYA